MKYYMKTNQLSSLLEKNNNEIEKLKKVIKEQEKIIRCLKEEKDGQLKEIYMLKESCNEKLNIINELNNEKIKMEEEIKELDFNLNELTNELKNANNTIIKLNNNLIISEEINKKNEIEFKQQIKELKNVINKEENNIREYKDEINKFNIFKEEIDSKLINISNQNNYFKEMNKKLIIELEKMIDRNKKIKDIIYNKDTMKDNFDIGKINDIKNNLDSLINSYEKSINIGK